MIGAKNQPRKNHSQRCRLLTEPSKRRRPRRGRKPIRLERNGCRPCRQLFSPIGPRPQWYQAGNGLSMAQAQWRGSARIPESRKARTVSNAAKETQTQHTSPFAESALLRVLRVSTGPVRKRLGWKQWLREGFAGCGAEWESGRMGEWETRRWGDAETRRTDDERRTTSYGSLGDAPNSGSRTTYSIKSFLHLLTFNTELSLFCSGLPGPQKMWYNNVNRREA